MQKLGQHQYKLILALFVLSLSNTSAKQIDDFSSDGCSRFPDGTFSQQTLWCDCCMTHDLAYWQGGSVQQKQQADQTLRTCVLQKTGSQLLADTMYFGVIVGGSPVFPTDYRWGYGWHYGRGFKTLSHDEKQQIDKKIIRYQKSNPSFSCDL